MKPPKILITGCCGLIGQILWRELADSFELYGIDLHQNERHKKKFRADISNLEQIYAVFRQIRRIKYIVHLAGDSRINADWQSVLMNNIVGTKNIYEAAMKHGVKRLVYASSSHVTVKG